jgi:hypothetical protein
MGVLPPLEFVIPFVICAFEICHSSSECLRGKNQKIKTANEPEKKDHFS